MTKGRRIHTPLGRWSGLFRMRVVPPAVWLAAVAGVVVLWQARASRVDTPGLIEARQAAVASVERGSATSLAADLLDEVQATQEAIAAIDGQLREATAHKDAAEVRVLIELPLSMAAPADARAAATFIPPRPGEVLDVRYFVSRRARRARADSAT